MSTFFFHNLNGESISLGVLIIGHKCCIMVAGIIPGFRFDVWSGIT